MSGSRTDFSSFFFRELGLVRLTFYRYELYSLRLMFYRYELYSLRLMFYRYELYSLRLTFYRYELYSLLVSSQCKCTSAPSDPGFSRDGSPGHTNGTMPFYYTLNVSLGLQHQSGQLQCTPPRPPPTPPPHPCLKVTSLHKLPACLHPRWWCR